MHNRIQKTNKKQIKYSKPKGKQTNESKIKKKVIILSKKNKKNT